MAARFPAFDYDHAAKSWRGPLQPRDQSPVYRLKVTYRVPKDPVIWVISPVPEPNAPHRYRDGSLCLHHPHDGDWDPALFVAETIMPWTAEWLFYYEAWLVDPERRWFGPEAPHSTAKRRHR